MTELFGRERGECRQGYLFDNAENAVDAADSETNSRRRPGESAVDFRIRRQYRDVAATAPLFALHGARR